MPRDRFFIAGVHAAGDRVAIAAADARKIVTVLRRRSGDRIEVVDAAGAAFGAWLAIDGQRVEVRLDELLDGRGRETTTRIVLAQAIPKGQKMDFIVEKATELGVAAIVPLRSARVTGERTGEHKHERWQRIAKAAAAQSGRALVPQVEPVVEWPQLLTTFGGYDRIYVAWEQAPPRPLRDRFEADARTAGSILVVIGPEGGLCPVEVEQATAAGGIAVSLGSRILRTETAGLVVVAALLYARAEL